MYVQDEGTYKERKHQQADECRDPKEAVYPKESKSLGDAVENEELPAHKKNKHNTARGAALPGERTNHRANGSVLWWLCSPAHKLHRNAFNKGIVSHTSQEDECVSLLRI